MRVNTIELLEHPFHSARTAATGHRHIELVIMLRHVAHSEDRDPLRDKVVVEMEVEVEDMLILDW
jgi:hypothetical protein